MQVVIVGIGIIYVLMLFYLVYVLFEGDTQCFNPQVGSICQLNPSPTDKNRADDPSLKEKVTE